MEDLVSAVAEVSASIFDWLRTARHLIEYAGGDPACKDVKRYLRKNSYGNAQIEIACSRHTCGERRERLAHTGRLLRTEQDYPCRASMRALLAS